MNWQIIGLAVIGTLMGVGYIWHKLRSASREIDRLLKTNEQLSQEKAVAETQVKHFEVRKNNDEKNRHLDRTRLIDGLRESGDLRD